MILSGIIYCVILLIQKSKHRHVKRGERRYFTASVKEETIQKQHHKCAICKKTVGVWDFDHKDGNRSNNDPNNCQALCPTCHAKKTRGLLKQEKRSSFVWRLIGGIILLLIFLHLIRVI
jgi:5-methylcytosine-specific restriction endonuclease McrA